MRRILRFTASWCQPCKALAKNLEAAALDNAIEVIDIDDNNDDQHDNNDHSENNDDKMITMIIMMKTQLVKNMVMQLTIVGLSRYKIINCGRINYLRVF